MRTEAVLSSHGTPLHNNDWTPLLQPTRHDVQWPLKSTRFLIQCEG